MSTFRLRSCATCGGDFEPSSDAHKYCSVRCRYTSPARAKYRKQWDELNPGRQALLARDSHLRKKFGLSLEVYDQMLADQNGVCAICGTDDTSPWKTFCVDHDHATGAVRGLLCQGCNTCIGQAGDDPERLRDAADYIESHR